MSRNILREALQVSVAIEKKASEIYLEISKTAQIEDQKMFWMEVSSDEKSHLDCWEGLLDLEKCGILANPFDHLYEAKAEFDIMLGKIEEYQVNKAACATVSDAILLAFQVESFMLHPAYFVFYRAFKEEFGENSPEDEYGRHLKKFVQFVAKHLAENREIKQMGNMLLRMFSYAREVANQFEQIKTLKGFIPICASCKRIRDDQGYWHDIEKYLSERSEAKFTHGICPKCKKELYPNLGKF